MRGWLDVGHERRHLLTPLHCYNQIVDDRRPRMDYRYSLKRRDRCFVAQGMVCPGLTAEVSMVNKYGLMSTRNGGTVFIIFPTKSEI